MADQEHPLISSFRRFSPTSETLARRAQTVFPGGDTRSSAHYGPYPLVMDCHYTASEARRINELGDQLREGFNRAFAQ
ncbi:MAG: hypothetical protein O2780_21285, partial [Proteobacteria bacterium]|nr:hypothetical protein [Pseudomonadota bacterium]